MTGARAERNEFLLLHEFHRQKYICPDKSLNFKSKEALEAIELDGDNGNTNNNNNNYNIYIYT